MPSPTATGWNRSPYSPLQDKQVPSPLQNGAGTLTTTGQSRCPHLALQDSKEVLTPAGHNRLPHPDLLDC